MHSAMPHPVPLLSRMMMFLIPLLSFLLLSPAPAPLAVPCGAEATALSGLGATRQPQSTYYEAAYANSHAASSRKILQYTKASEASSACSRLAREYEKRIRKASMSIDFGFEEMLEGMRAEAKRAVEQELQHVCEYAYDETFGLMDDYANRVKTSWEEIKRSATALDLSALLAKVNGVSSGQAFTVGFRGPGQAAYRGRFNTLVR